MAEKPDAASVKDSVREQFGASAHAYVTSASHASGDDLARLLELAAPSGSERVLDVATGGGHTALAFAPHVARVTAIDLTPAMLEEARAHAARRAAPNVTFDLADAEALPYEDASFDIVVARIAPHHFADPQAFVRESARVLSKGGLFLLDDNMAPEDDELDEFMNRFEKWRDPSHVRAHKLSQWRAWMVANGLRIVGEDALQSKRYAFDEWTARMRMPADDRRALERWLLAAPKRCTEFFGLELNAGRVTSVCGTFAIIAARKP
ncbi:MAG TPA: methyltransferase domain-containing protein [Candidatus Eremiobacteraceae bacterium]|nr:methyltransferase domain-containing protein [Candidatus Eremiobacteraceae bacterium]